jgi:hypothetical protein
MKTKYLIGNVNLGIFLIQKVSAIPYLILVGNIDYPNLFSSSNNLNRLKSFYFKHCFWRSFPKQFFDTRERKKAKIFKKSWIVIIWTFALSSYVFQSTALVKNKNKGKNHNPIGTNTEKQMYWVNCYKSEVGKF